MRTIRNNKDRIEAMYNNLLAYCGNSGDWVGAIRAYEVSSKTLIHHCNPMSQLPLRLALLAANSVGIVISLVEIN